MNFAQFLRKLIPGSDPWTEEEVMEAHELLARMDEDPDFHEAVEASEPPKPVEVPAVVEEPGEQPVDGQSTHSGEVEYPDPTPEPTSTGDAQTGESSFPDPTSETENPTPAPETSPDDSGTDSGSGTPDDAPAV